MARATHAQDAAGAVVRAVVGTAALERTNGLDVRGTVGYRLNSAIGLEVEITSIPMLDPDLPQSAASTFGIVYTDAGGRAALFTTNVRLELPGASRRVIPFVVGGGGVANISTHYTISITRPPVTVPPGVFRSTLIESSLVSNTIAGPVAYPQRVGGSPTGMVLNLGGGASFLVTDHLAIEADLRYGRILSDYDSNMGRFGGGVSYRF
jgi:hypothetical protein